MFVSLVPDPALLSVVVKITPEDYWLVSGGLWKGPTTACKAFEDMKLSCTGAAANHNVFKGDFPIALKNLEKLMELASTPGFKTPATVIKNHKIKFKHVLFTVRNYHLYLLKLPF